MAENIEKGYRDDSYENLAVYKGTNVVQSNFLIENKPKMTRDAMKLFGTLIANIQKDDTELKNIKLMVSDLIKLWDMDPKNAYRQVQNALNCLLHAEFALEVEREDGTLLMQKTTYIQKYSYGQGDGYALVQVDSMFKPYLIDLKEQYTLYALENLTNLETSNAMRIYELLMQYEGLGKRIFTVSEFKKKLGIEGKYKSNNSNLRTYVLDPAVMEISERTNILTRYILEGRGEKAKITFSVIRKADVLKGPRKDKNFGKNEKSILLQLLVDEERMDAHFTETQIKRAIEVAVSDVRQENEIMDRYELLRDAYREFDERAAETEIKNKWGYFKKILEAKKEKEAW